MLYNWRTLSAQQIMCSSTLSPVKFKNNLHFKEMWLSVIMTATLITGSSSQAAGLKWSCSSLHCTLSATAHPEQQMFFCRKLSWSHNSWEKKLFYRQMFLIWKPIDGLPSTPATDPVSLCKPLTVWASTNSLGLWPLALTKHRPPFAYNIQVYKQLQIISKSANNMWFNKQGEEAKNFSIYNHIVEWLLLTCWCPKAIFSMIRKNTTTSVMIYHDIWYGHTLGKYLTLWTF